MRIINGVECDECSECNGNGGFWINWPEEEWEQCDNCSGTGIDSGDYEQAMWAGVSEEEAKSPIVKQPKNSSYENPEIVQKSNK